MHLYYFLSYLEGDDLLHTDSTDGVVTRCVINGACRLILSDAVS